MRTLLTALFVTLFSATCFAELVPNPAYEGWAACKPGSTITHKMTNKIDMEGQQMDQTATQEEKLVEVTPEHAVVSMTVTVSMMGHTMTQPATTVKIPAKVEKDKLAAVGQSPSANLKITEMKESKETIEVKGKKLDCTKYEYTVEMSERGQAMAGKVKCWVSKEIPGGAVKMEMDVTKPMKMTTVREITDYNIIK
ncbi:MAG: hypothetical protein FWD53_10865 [Phycisphaerales bacterium]|nr:hypothetical protein [Phycisphaerales bacterium]